MIQKICRYSLLFHQSMYQKFAVAEETEHNISPKKLLTVKLWVSICFAFCHSMKSIHLT